MGRLKTWDIFFQEDKTVYYPGQAVSGRVHLDIRGDIRLRCLRVCMKGVAKVHWTEARNTGTRLGPYTEHYEAEMAYFTKRSILFGSESVDARHVLSEGQHDFTFQFTLPLTGLSTSFEGKYGSIRYWLKAEIEKPWSFNCKVKKAFTVITPLDINRTELLCAVENCCDTMLCCWCCSSGPISMVARTDRMGFCPGESIAITATFENCAGRRITPHATLIQTQVFLANGKQRSRQTKFTMLTGPVIQAGTMMEWDAQLLKIPAVSPSILTCCLMKVHYTVRITLQIPVSSNITMDLPIIIGTVPFRPRLRNSTSQPQPLSHMEHLEINLPVRRSVNQMRAALYLAGPMPPMAPPYQEVFGDGDDSQHQLALATLPPPPPPPPLGPPPMYAECINGTVDIGDDDGESTFFTPMYTYVQDYQFRPPPAYSELDPHPTRSI